jgi:hypothetical protein
MCGLKPNAPFAGRCAWSIIKIPVKGIAIDAHPTPRESDFGSRTLRLASWPAHSTGCRWIWSAISRNLSRVEIIVGPAHGAEMLMAGIRSMHARHPNQTETGVLHSSPRGRNGS